MSHPASLDYLHAATRWFGRSPEQLGARERRALEGAAARRALSEDPNCDLEAQSTFGEHIADRVARLGGSWTFIGIFVVFLIAWTVLNKLSGTQAVDPYPFIFLNLLLSMVAALQAPVIMMSQNRQSKTDRKLAAHDYQVNLKAEIEIMALHDKMDALRSEQLTAMLEKQQQQIELLTQLLAREPR